MCDIQPLNLLLILLRNSIHTLLEYLYGLHDSLILLLELVDILEFVVHSDTQDFDLLHPILVEVS